MEKEKITIKNGALAMDGGSIALEALDAAHRTLRIRLDWSIAAQRAGTTCLAIDQAKVARGSLEEARWIEVLRSAHIDGGDRIAFLRDSVLEKLQSPRHEIPTKISPTR